MLSNVNLCTSSITQYESYQRYITVFQNVIVLTTNNSSAPTNCFTLQEEFAIARQTTAKKAYT